MLLLLNGVGARDAKRFVARIQNRVVDSMVVVVAGIVVAHRAQQLLDVEGSLMSGLRIDDCGSKRQRMSLERVGVARRSADVPLEHLASCKSHGRLKASYGLEQTSLCSNHGRTTCYCV